MLILTTLAVVVAAFFWNRIAGFLVNTFLPFIREHAYPAFKVVAAVVDFVNKGMVMVRNAIVDGYNWIKNNLLHCSTTYELDSANNVHATTVTVIQENGKVRGIETKEVVNKWDMPAEAFARLSHNAQQQVNCKDELLRKAEQAAAQQQLTLATQA